MRRGEVEVRDHRGNRRSEGERGKGEGGSEKVRGGSGRSEGEVDKVRE